MAWDHLFGPVQRREPLSKGLPKGVLWLGFVLTIKITAGAFVIHDVEHRLVLPCVQNVEDFCEGSDERCAGVVWHWVGNDGVKVINVCNKYVLHNFEGSNRKHPGDIRV